MIRQPEGNVELERKTSAKKWNACQVEWLTVKSCAKTKFTTSLLQQEVSSMIRFQIIERTGVNLHKTLIDAMRAGELRTFEATKRGRRIQHKNILYPGWMNWSVHDGMINCEVISPRKPGREWQLFSAFLGRLADRYADQIIGINIQFPAEPSKSPKSTVKKRRRKS